MAIVGERLTTPESGWKRYGSRYSSFKYNGFSMYADSNKYEGQSMVSPSVGGTISYLFYGTKLRHIHSVGNGAGVIEISIDGVKETIDLYSSSAINTVLVYEKTNLELRTHEVVVTHKTKGSWGSDIHFEAIDIDSTGYLLHPDEVTNIHDLVVGKRIRCHYQASSGQVGIFSGLGRETSDFIPKSSSLTPDGDFYFIMTENWNGKKYLIPDRNIQSGISWDTLNNIGVSSGSGLPINYLIYQSVVPMMTSNSTPSPYVVSSNGNSGSAYEPYKAFDKKFINSSTDRWVSNTTSPTTDKILTIDLGNGNEKKVIGYTIISLTSGASATQAPKTWYLEGSNNNNNWIQVDYRNNEVGWLTNEKRFYNCQNVDFYRYYRLRVVNTNGESYVSIAELELIDNAIEYNLSVRLPTGGVSATDRDNEWDKYIVNSTLNGTITAGDNNVWNWSGLSSWTSTTFTSQAANRVVRGSSSVDTYSHISSSTSSVTYGFRPVLIVEPLIFPPTFEGGIDKTSIHSDDVTLAGTISDPDNNSVQYRILINGVNEYPSEGYTDFMPSPLAINYTISNSKFILGSNQISLEMVNSKGSEASWITTVTLDSQNPTITAFMTGMQLNATIEDPENDTVQFKVVLNDVQIYPNVGYTSLVPTPVNYQRIFHSNEINLGSNNTVQIIVLDKYGAQSEVTLNFIGEYTGLLFFDTGGNYYSTDIGEVLKYLDFGTLVAGQSSLDIKVNLKNTYPYNIQNIRLWSEHSIEGLAVELSKTNNPFIANSSLIYGQVMSYNDSLEFYVRLKVDTSAQVGGTFDIRVSADPV
ncbi:discoidin domain-containing protein [Paenibacillus naphthalenovorans]|uniref:F5/8 type C domain-containing protein n=1 Tax=Paenibacillus naphthalenovorans TaxID=162209 RepID=A0A0U2U812_9BACL|nr:discoidin domain-containing protein [Paenibacillus naphthalenovorans]ALS22328.1 hypothetical protein IJ22_19540 [Paenibacillus naphthalenovorans]